MMRACVLLVVMLAAPLYAQTEQAVQQVLEERAKRIEAADAAALRRLEAMAKIAKDEQVIAAINAAIEQVKGGEAGDSESDDEWLTGDDDLTGVFPTRDDMAEAERHGKVYQLKPDPEATQVANKFYWEFERKLWDGAEADTISGYARRTKFHLALVTAYGSTWRSPNKLIDTLPGFLGNSPSDRDFQKRVRAVLRLTNGNGSFHHSSLRQVPAGLAKYFAAAGSEKSKSDKVKLCNDMVELGVDASLMEMVLGDL